MPTASATIERTHYLDGLRGVAALVVVIGHLDIFLGFILGYEGWGNFAREGIGRAFNGNFAVCIFFVLSGYLLTMPSVRHGNGARAGEAAARRYFRLTPIVLVSVILAYFLWVIVGIPSGQMTDFGQGFRYMQEEYQFHPSLMEVIGNGLFGVYFGDNRYNGPLWTIQIELWGSLLLFAFIALFAQSRHYVALCAVVSVFLISWLGEWGIYYSLFFAGSAVCHLKLRVSPWLLIPALYLGTVSEWTPDFVALVEAAGLPTSLAIVRVAPHAIAAVLLISVLLSNNQLQRAFSTRSARYLGRVSYALYAVHIPVLYTLGNQTFIWVAGMAPLWAAAIANLSVTIGISMLLAHLLSRFVDEPAQSLAKLVGRWLVASRQSEREVLDHHGKTTRVGEVRVSH